MDLSLKELQVLREGVESLAIKADPEVIKELRDKLDKELGNKGYKFVVKAFYTEWKKLDKK
jgi:hypothetical protein